MTKLTILEATILKIVRDECFNEVDTTVQEIAKISGERVNTIKGVIGSLHKKQYVAAGIGEEANTGKEYECVNFIAKDGSCVSFGCDNYADDEMLSDEEIDALVK